MFIDSWNFSALFNVAVKTKSGDEGHKVSLVYPKNSYDLSFNLKSSKINENSFDFAGLISSFTKGFAGFFSSFSSLSNLSSFSNPLKPATTTVEPFEDFGKEDGDSWSSSDGDNESSSSSSIDNFDFTPDEINSDFSPDSSDSGSSPDSNDFDIRTGGDTEKGYEYPKQTTGSVTQESVKVSYLPPVTSMRPPRLPTSEPTKNYLPPSTKKPTSLYLPSF